MRKHPLYGTIISIYIPNWNDNVSSPYKRKYIVDSNCGEVIIYSSNKRLRNAYAGDYFSGFVQNFIKTVDGLLANGFVCKEVKHHSKACKDKIDSIL